MCKSWMSVLWKSTGHVESSCKRLPCSANSCHRSLKSLIIPSIRPSKVSEDGDCSCALMRAPCWRLQRYSLRLRAIPQSSNPYPSCMHNGSIRPRISFQHISMVSLIRHPKALYQPSHPSPIIVSSFSGYPPFPVSYRSSSQDRTCSSVLHHSVPPRPASATPQALDSSNHDYFWCQESSISIQVHYAPSWEVTTAGAVDLRNQHGHSQVLHPHRTLGWRQNHGSHYQHCRCPPHLPTSAQLSNSDCVDICPRRHARHYARVKRRLPRHQQCRTSC